MHPFLPFNQPYTQPSNQPSVQQTNHRSNHPYTLPPSRSRHPPPSAKVDEINTILENEITPTLDRLRGEKTQFLKWASNDAEAQRLQKFCVAHNFVEAEAKLSSSNGEKQELEAQRDALQTTQAEASVSRWSPYR